jgi:pimeloyl-ACP methyl ester carboxylesterase
MARQRWTPTTPGAARGRVLLIHGLSSIADSWWRIGPALAGLGWDVSAVDQGGHFGRPLAGEATGEALADAVLAVHPEPPDVLIGHSLGTVTAGVLEGGSVLRAADRAALPDGHLIELDGGHCLHRDVPGEWLDTVGGILGDVPR